MKKLAEVYKNMVESGNAPTVRLDPIYGGIRLTVTNARGETQTRDIFDGKSVTHSWDGTTLYVTSANGTSSANLKGERGEEGSRGPQGRGIAGVEETSDVDGVKTYTITMTDGSTFIFTVADGDDGKDGKDGTSITHSWDGTTLYVTSASGTTSANLKGEKGDRGQGFSISKIYASVAQMKAAAATDGVPEGGFVLIETGNVEDKDNAKLYVKSGGNYSYLTDLSGSQGIRGEKGPPGNDGVGIANIAYASSSGLVDTYTIFLTNGNTYNFKITNGKNGSPGANGTSAYHHWDGTKLTITSASGTSTADLKGDKGDDGVLTPEQETLLTAIPELKAWYDEEHYVKMTGSFTPEYSSKTVDIGTTIKETFTWDFSKELKELYINKVLQQSKLQKGDTGELTIECLNSDGNHTDGTKEISIKGVHAGPYGDEDAYKIWTFNFLNKLYYGARAGETIDEAGVKELSKSAYATTFKNTGFNLNDSSSDKYLWYVFPERFEDKKAPVFTVGGFEGSFKKVATIQDFANDESFEEPYSVYRSIFPGICDMTVTVS